MQRIVCFGDSITAGSKFAEGRRWTSLLNTELEQSQPETFEIYNRGVGGYTTTMGLDRFDIDIKPLLPGYVLIEFGLNDANVLVGRKIPRCGLVAFRENLLEIIRKIQKGKGKPILLTNHLIRERKPRFLQGNGKRYMENFAPYQVLIRTIAQSTRTPLIDLEQSMQSEGLKAANVVEEDGIHLSVEGNRVYMEHVAKGLLPLISKKMKS